MNNLALIYQVGENGVVEQDIFKTIELYEKASELDHSTAINNLAVIYQYGVEDFVERDILKSIEFRASS